MKISIGCDHAGFDYKEAVKVSVGKNDSIAIVDRGTFSSDSVDYPDFAHLVAQDVASGDADFGILICGSANGVAMAANKHAQVRCAICWSKEITTLARSHNDANIIALPARFISVQQAQHYAQIFIESLFEGGRHTRRVDKIACS